MIEIENNFNRSKSEAFTLKESIYAEKLLGLLQII